MASSNVIKPSGTDIFVSDSFFWTPDYLEPSAWIEHIPFAFWLIENFKPASLVELGVYNGTSYFSFCQAVDRLNLTTKTYGVDTWKGDEHAGFYDDDIYKRVDSYNAGKFSRFSTLIRSSFDEARQYFTNGSIDLLHIDGLHTYEAVKHDFENWLPALSGNAIVVFHDINVRERGFGVFQFWEELRQQYRHFEFDFGFGLGIICLGKNYGPVLNSLFDRNKSSEYYSGLKNLLADRGFFFKKTLEFLFAKNEAADLRYKFTQANETTEQLNKQVTGIQQQLEHKENEITALKADIKNYEETTAKLTTEISGIVRHEVGITDIKELLNKTTEENSLYRKKNMRLQNFVNQLQQNTLELKIFLEQRNIEIGVIQKGRLKDTQLINQLRFSNDLMKEQIAQSEALSKALHKSTIAHEQELRNRTGLLFEKARAVQLPDLRSTANSTGELENGGEHEEADSNQSANSGWPERSGNTSNSQEDKNRNELFLTAKDSGSMTPPKPNSPATRNQLVSFFLNVLNRFPRLAFFVKKNILLLKWTLQGTRSKFKYRIDFWNRKRYVPYKAIDDYITLQQSALYDEKWYLTTYEDVKNDNADPTMHYLFHGYKEGRDPGPAFSTASYLKNYPDVKDAGINPLLHYLYKGKEEGRKAFNRGGGKEDYSFPYPVSSTKQNAVDATAHAPKKPEQMPHSEPDFLKRNYRKRNAREITNIKTVAFIAQPEYFSFHYTSVLESLYNVRYFPNSFSGDPHFFKELVEFDADINIFFRGEIVPNEVLDALRGIRVALSSEPFPKILNNSMVYTADSLERFEFFLKIFDQPFDYIFHYDEVSKLFFERQGIELSGYFPFPVATEVIKPVPSEKKWDLFFSGRSTPHRDQYFGPLKRDFNFLHINHGVAGSDLLDFIHKCKISVNIHAEDEISWEPRTQFLMAAGSLLVSEPLSPTCPLRPGIDFIEVKDAWNMYETCQQIIKNYESFRHIAESGRNRIDELLSSRKNFPVFFNNLVKGRYNAASFNKNRLMLEPLKTNLKYNGFGHLLTELLHEHA